MQRATRLLVIGVLCWAAPPTTPMSNTLVACPSSGGVKASLPQIAKWIVANLGKRDVEEPLDDVALWCGVAKPELWQGVHPHIDPEGALKRWPANLSSSWDWSRHFVLFPLPTISPTIYYE